MSTTSTNHQIGIISDFPHERSRLSALLSAQPQFEVSIHDTGDLASAMFTKWDVILYCAAVEQDDAKLVDVLAQSQRIAPCIMALAQPTADQCVDLMQAGAYGVADWQHTERILYLIYKALDAWSAQQTKPVPDEQPSRYLPTVNNDLQSLHTHLGAVLDSMQDALLCVGLPDRQVIFVSNAFEEVFGYPHERFTEDADFYQKIVHPDDLVRVTEAIQTCLRDGFVEVDHRVIFPDGQVRWLHRRAWVNYDENGRPVRVNDSARNITERIQTEDALRQSEQRYRRMFEAVKLPKLIIDPQTARILDANAAAVDFYGYPLETLKTMTMMQINIAESEVILNMMAQVLSGEISSCTFEQRLADGTIRDVEGFATGIELNGQRTLYCTYVDMTERNRSRKALEEANQRLEQRVVERTKALREAKDRIEAIFNHSGDGIVLLDVEHGIQQTNHAFNRMFGLAEDDYFDRKLSEFVSDGYRTRLELAIQATTIRHETRRMEIQGRRADDGTTFEAEISIAPVKDSEDAVEDIVCIFRDITEQRASQAALRNSEERYRTLITTMSEGIVLQDRNGAIQAWNPAAERILGLSADQINQRTSIDPRWGTVHEDGSDFPVETHPAMIALKTGQPQSNVLMGVHRPDSFLRWILVNAQPVFQPDHKRPVAVVTTFTDITERRTIEEALRVATERLQLATSAGRIGIWDYDAESDVMHWDEQMFKLYGVDGTQVMPSVEFWQSAVHPDDIARAQAEAEAAARGEIAYDSEFRIVTPDGEIRYLHAIANLYWDDCGRHRRTVGVNIDITEQKTAQIALRDSEERYRTFIEASPIAVIVSDANGKIVLTNKAAEQIFGYERDELIGAPMQMLIPHEFREAHALIIEEFVSAHQHRLEAMELSARRKDGLVFPADVQLSLVNLHPAPLVMALMIDITRRKQAEETLWMALEKEKELGELKSRFVSMASHQFRTPLAAILANTETLSVYRERMDSSQIDMRLDRIRKQVLYMKDIMEDVLELARIQANQLQYQPVVGDLGALCQEIIEDFEHQKGYRDRIVYSGPENPLTAEFDPHLMHHVISNLIHNALKYSSHEQPVYVHFSQTDAGITLSVKDQGIGIQPDDLKHLFKPFYRAANVGAITGTGLGLSITKQVIDAHGGTVHVESTPESGTVFMVTLPQKDCIDDKNSRD